MSLERHGEIRAALPGGGIFFVFERKSLLAQQQGRRFQFGAQIFHGTLVAGVLYLCPYLRPMAGDKRLEAARSPHPTLKLGIKRRLLAVKNLVQQIVERSHLVIASYPEARSAGENRQRLAQKRRRVIGYQVNQGQRRSR